MGGARPRFPVGVVFPVSPTSITLRFEPSNLIVSTFLAAVTELVPPVPGRASAPLLALTVNFFIPALPVPVVLTATVSFLNLPPNNTTHRLL